ncbi:hypothetical protein [Streptomyces sp. b94]|uniref:hypothetical protein n=1 Tax=Streptomyces sp. b94 TaxID=1827634 RepID=UPI001FFD27F4|nr:hypothetical protein [Streptomyces sp. b94]
MSTDVNHRSKLWAPDTAWRELRRFVAEADIVVAGIEEAQLVIDSKADVPVSLAADLAASGPREAVVETGAGIFPVKSMNGLEGKRSDPDTASD